VQSLALWTSSALSLGDGHQMFCTDHTSFAKSPDTLVLVAIPSFHQLVHHMHAHHTPSHWPLSTSAGMHPPDSTITRNLYLQWIQHHWPIGHIPHLPQDRYTRNKTMLTNIRRSPFPQCEGF